MPMPWATTSTGIGATITPIMSGPRSTTAMLSMSYPRFSDLLQPTDLLSDLRAASAVIAAVDGTDRGGGSWPEPGGDLQFHPCPAWQCRQCRLPRGLCRARGLRPPHAFRSGHQLCRHRAVVADHRRVDSHGVVGRTAARIPHPGRRPDRCVGRPQAHQCRVRVWTGGGGDRCDPAACRPWLHSARRHDRKPPRRGLVELPAMARLRQSGVSAIQWDISLARAVVRQYPGPAIHSARLA